jgi:CubicO group peptidase (beta-lactamase class C family)
MKKHIWSKLGVTSTTFHPELYPDSLPPKLEMANRVSVGQGAKSIKAGSVILGQPLKDDLGGIGLWSTPKDFIKLLTALLRGGEPLLTKDSLEILFRPQLSDASRAAMPLSLGSRMRAILGIRSVNVIDQADHCLAGTTTLKDIPGRRPRGTISWSGLPNLHWVRINPCYSAGIKNLSTDSFIWGTVD